MKTLILPFLLLLLNLEIKSKNSTNTFQDPVRTSDNKKIDPDKNLNGSTGRYKKDHKHANGKKFATNKRHIKTAKPGNDNGGEKQKGRGTETATK